MANEINFKDTHSGEIQEIIGKAPSWPIKKGSFIICVLIVVLFVSARFIKYPEIVSTSVILISIDPTVKVLAKISGQISEIKVKEGTIVTKNENIATIGSIKVKNDILHLKKIISDLNKMQNIQNDFSRITVPDDLEVDEVQSDYEQLKKHISLRKESRFISLVDRIKQKIDLWESRHLLFAPVNGKIYSFDLWKTEGYVTAGKPVFIVVPKIKKYDAWLQLPVSKAGKVKVGQKVLIKLQEYPFQEYGVIHAQVESISDVAISNTYATKLKLDSSYTVRNKLISQHPKMIGIADIVTNDKNILERLFEGFLVRINVSRRL